MTKNSIALEILWFYDAKWFLNANARFVFSTFQLTSVQISSISNEIFILEPFLSI